MAKTIDVPGLAGMSTDQLQGEAARIAGEAHQYYGQGKVKERATRDTAVMSGRLAAIAATASDQGINKMAYLQDVDQTAKLDAINLEDTRVGEGFGNQMTAVTSVDEAKRQGLVDYNAAMSNITAMRSEKEGFGGWMMDSEQAEFQAYVLKQTENMTDDQKRDIYAANAEYLTSELGGDYGDSIWD